jgi:hypothetical protein
MQYGHWSHTCRMAKHLIDLYQSSLKGKEKNIKINFSHPRQGNDDIYPLDMTHLDVIYFFFSKHMTKLIFLVMIIIS